MIEMPGFDLEMSSVVGLRSKDFFGVLNNHIKSLYKWDIININDTNCIPVPAPDHLIIVVIIFKKLPIL